jgi:hypothetical protein
MGKASTIKTLPDDILEQLQALLRDPRVTQLDATARLNAILAEQGEAPVSKSAVNRYSLQMDKVGAKLAQSRAIADMWIGKLGNEPAGKVGALLNEMVRNLAFDTAMHMAEDEAPADPKLIKALAEAIEKLERASSENEKRTVQIRAQALQEATDKASQAARRIGLSSEAIAEFKREMLGVPAA